jgi:4-hydroxybenzoate polyprenyltransferase
MPSRSLIAGLVAACHPGPTAAVTAMATTLAIAVGRTTSGCLWTAAAIGTGQLSIGWCNDAVDAHRDQLVGRADKPVVAGIIDRRLLAACAGGAALAAVPLSLASGIASAGVHLTAVASAWSYNLWLKRTVMSFLPYLVSFGLLPAVVTLGLAGAPLPAWWAMTGAGLLGIGAHAANVVPDIDGDLRTGVRGLPQRLGHRGGRLLTAGALFAGALVLALGPESSDGLNLAIALTAGALAAGAALAPATRPGGRRRQGPLLFAIALAALGLASLIVRGTEILAR